MKKVDMLRGIAATAGMSVKDVKIVMKALSVFVMNNIHYEDKRDDEHDGIPILDGLKVYSQLRASRNATNPQTHESIVVPEKVVPKARFGKLIKDAAAEPPVVEEMVAE